MRRWGLGLGDGIGELDRPSGLLLNLFAGDAWVHRDDPEFIRFRVRTHDAEVCYQERRSFRWDSEFAALAAGSSVAQSRHKIDVRHETAWVVLQDQEDLAAAHADLACASAAGQTNFGPIISADHGAVQVSKAIDLCAAEKAHCY